MKMKVKIIEKKDGEKVYQNIVLTLQKGLDIPIKASFDAGKSILWFLSKCEVEVTLHMKESNGFENYYLVLNASENYFGLPINAVFPMDYRILKGFCIADWVDSEVDNA